MQDGSQHISLRQRVGAISETTGVVDDKSKTSGKLSLRERVGDVKQNTQQEFQDDAIKDVSDKMENAVKQEQIDELLKEKIQKTITPSVFGIDAVGAVNGLIEGIKASIKTFGEVGTAAKEGDVAGVIAGSIYGTGEALLGLASVTPQLGAFQTAIGKVVDSGLVPEETMQWATMPLTTLMNKVEQDPALLAQIIGATNNTPALQEVLKSPLGRKSLAGITDIGLQGAIFHGITKGIKSIKGSKNATDVQGGQNLENPTQTKALTEIAGRDPLKQEFKKRQQSANSESVGERPFEGSQVGDTKIKLTPEEQLSYSKKKVEVQALADEVGVLQNKIDRLGNELKTKRTKVNKEAYKKLNEELENKQAERLNTESELQAIGAYAEQRQLKGLISERGSSTKGTEVTGENVPSAVDFTSAQDPLGRIGGTETITTRKGEITKPTEGIPSESLHPVKTSIHDYLVNRGLDLFKVVKADKPIDSGALGDILRQAKENGVYEPVLDILREEAFKRGKTLQFETALKNSTVKTTAENVKPSELGEGVKSETEKLYHGSSKKFNGFDFEKVKTGDDRNLSESGMAWGIYTADSPRRGAYYSEKLSGKDKSNAYVYEIEKPLNAEIMQWDNAVTTQQAKQIASALRRSGKTDGIYNKIMSDLSEPVLRGSDIYNALKKELGSQKNASLLLKDAKIDGTEVKNIITDKAGNNKSGSDYVWFNTDKLKINNVTENVKSTTPPKQSSGLSKEDVSPNNPTIEEILGHTPENILKGFDAELPQWIESAKQRQKFYESKGNYEEAALAKAEAERYQRKLNAVSPSTGNIKSNRVISEELNKKADDILRDNLNNLGSNPLFNAKLYEALAIKGAYYFENGATSLAKWSKKMVEEYGEKIRPALMGIWNDIQKNAELKQTAIANSLGKNEKVNKLNDAVVLESKPVETTPFEHTFKTLVESQALNTMGKYVEKQGEAGKTLVDAGNKVFRESSQLSSKYIKLYHDSIMSLNKMPNLVKEFIKIANEGGKSTNPLVNKALDAWNTIRTEIAQKSTEQEMTMSYFDAKSKSFKERPFAPIENFFPHKFDFNKLRSAKFRSQFLNNLASKLDVSRPEAERIWNQYARKNTINEFKNIERVRQFDIDGWRAELEVIPEYIQGASRRLKEVEIFGKEYQKANEWISKIDKDGKDYTAAQVLFDKWVGRDRYNRDFARYVAKLNDWQVLNKLGLLNLLNWTQIGNAGMLFGTRSFVKQIVKQARDYPEMRRFVEPSGALDNSLAAYQLDAMASSGIGDFMLRKTGVVAQERWNRVFSASMGMDYMTRQLNSLIKNPNNKKLRSEMQRKIDMLNLNKEISIDKALGRGKFTEKELLDVGYEGARKTQFLSRPQDLPNFMSNKDLKFFTLFKSFVMQQSTLVKDAVIKETFKGNIRPLLFMATVFPALGEIANTARAIVSNDKKGMDESLLLHKQEWSKVIERYAIDLATIGSFGFAYDVARASAYSPQGLIGWLAGANAGDIAEGTYAGLTAALTGNFSPLTKFAARQIPIPIVKQQIGNMLKEDSGKKSGRSY